MDPRPPAIAALALAARIAQAQVAHLIARDDLECAAYGKEIVAAIESAQAAPLVILELRADRSRTDIAWTIAQGVRSSKAPVAVLLGDERAHAEALAIALLGASASVRPDTRIGSAGALRALAPEDTDWERIEREFAGELWLRLRDTPAGERFAAALLRPADRAWIVRGDGGTTIAWEPPAPGADAAPIVSESGEFDLGAKDAASLDLCDIRARGLAEILTRHGVPSMSIRKRELRSGLAEARREVVAALDRAAVDAGEADRLLDPPRSGAPAIAPSRRQENIRRAMALTAESIDRIASAEGWIEQYPEVLRTPAPGQTTVGAAPEGAWRRLFQDRRDELEELRLRAEQEIRR